MLRLILVVLLAHSMLGCVSAPDQVVDVPKAPPEYAGDTLEQWLSWSEPDNGIAARIEYLIPPTAHDGGALYLRLMNVGDEPVTVPAGEIGELSWMRCFELYHRQDQEWQPVFWPVQHRHFTFGDLETTTLEPGASTVLGLMRGMPKQIMASTHIKVVLQLNGTGILENDRSAVEGNRFVADPHIRSWVEGDRLTDASIETPPYPTHFTQSMDESRLGQYTVPSLTPFENGGRFNLEEEVKDGLILGGMTNGPPDPIYVIALISGRWEAIQLLSLYRGIEVRSAMDRLLGEPDRDPHWRLMIAALAAREGSEKGQAIIRDAIDRGEGELIRSALAAISFILRDQRPQAWAAETALEAIKDQRVVRQAYGQKTVADLAIDDYHALLGGLSKRKPDETVPVLIQRVQATGGEYDSIRALGQIGDQRAAPVLVALLERRLEDDWDASYNNGVILSAIRALHPPDAIDLLIEHVDKKDVAKTLGRMGDPRAIPAIRPLADRGDLDARIALHRLGASRVEASLVRDLTDRRIDELGRTDILWSLSDMNADGIVPLLVWLIHEDPSGTVTGHAIWALEKHKTRQTVEGLITCFDVDYSEKSFWKPAYRAEHFSDAIAKVLKNLTGQSFGNNPAAWRAWWEAEGRASFGKE